MRKLAVTAFAFVLTATPAYAGLKAVSVLPNTNGIPGGTNGQAQYNNNGALGGSPYVTLGSTAAKSFVDTGTVTIGTGPFSTNTPNGSELYLQTVIPSAASNYHGLTVADVYTPTTAGLAYASINNYTTFNGSVNNDHFNGFQDAGTLASTGTTNIYGSFVSTFNVQNGTLTTANAFTCGDVNLSAGGAVTTHACFTAGVISAATNNYFLYSSSTLLPSFHAGPFYLGGVLTGAQGQVAGNAYISFPTGQNYLKVGGTQPFSWGTSITTANVILGDQGTTGSSVFIPTAGFNSAFASGLGVYGTYSAPISTVDIAAVGTKSGGGFGANLAFLTSNGASQNSPALTLDLNNHAIFGGLIVIPPTDLTASTTLTVTSGYYQRYKITAAATNTLPTAPANGTSFCIKNAAASSATLTNAVGSGDTIDSAAATLASGNAACPLIYDSANKVWDLN